MAENNITDIHRRTGHGIFWGGYDFILPEYYGPSKFARIPNFAQITWIS